MRLAAQGWRHIRYPLFRRLTFFAATDTELIPHRLGLDWLLAEEHWWLWSVETTRETIRLHVALVPELDEAELLELESAVLAGPPRNMYREDIDDELWMRVRDREIWLRLAKIDETGGRLSPAAAKRLTDLSARHPSWRLSEDHRDEFHHWMGDGEELRTFVRSPREPTELVEWLKTYRTSEFWEEDDWRDRCREDFPTTAQALSTLAAQGEWPSARWSTALHAWSEGKLIAPAWELMALVLENAPPKFLKNIDHALSWWLREIARTFQGNETTFLSLCERVLRLEHEPQDETDDVVGRAINHPVGHVTDALLRWWYRQELEDQQGLPDELSVLFTELCDVSVDAYRHARVLLAARVVTLFRVDRKWTTKHLLPLFGWKGSGLEARGAWEGFLGSPQLYAPLMEAFKAAFLQTAQHYDALGRYRRQYASVLVFAALDPRDMFKTEELATATWALPPDGLEQAAAALARAIEGAGDQRVDYWNNRVMPYLKGVFPNVQERITPAITGRLAHVCIASGDAFPAALRQLRAWLQSVKYPHHLVHRLHEAGLCERFPEQTLDFLDQIVRDETQWPPSELRDCLTAIQGAKKKLGSDRRFRRLRDYLRKFDKDLN